MSSNSPTVLTNFFPWDENYVTSLHATGQGKKTWYDETPNRGFERFTNVSYSDLGCKNCHEPSATGGCESCHNTANPTLGSQVDATLSGACGACHGRQKAEAIVHGYSDVHRDAGMDCMACHTLGDDHGDGTAYMSMLDDGAIDTKCTDCHTALASNTYHDTHSETVDCSACHVQSVVSCYNCHFETEVELHTKKAYGQFKDWIFLVNWNGKVHAANFQSVKYGDNTLVAMAPFYSHTIARNARACDDCHGNAAMTDWEADGVIDVVVWDSADSKLNYMNGVIPVPPNYLTGLRFDFVDLDEPGGTVWSFLKTGADTIQMVYGEPLTEAQMEKLKQ
jgi:predicted CXXCH cytochrome family protein